MNINAKRKEILTVDFMRKTFAAQGYNFDHVNKNIIIYNYDNQSWLNSGQVVPLANEQIRRIGERIQATPLTPMYELAGIVIAGVDGWDYRRPKTSMVVRPHLNTPGVEHVYNIIARDTNTGNLVPMSPEWASTGDFNSVADVQKYAIEGVLNDIIEQSVRRRRMLLKAIECPYSR